MARKQKMWMAGLAGLAAVASVTAWAVEGRPRGPGHRPPPPEAIQACQGKSEGEPVEVTLPSGEKVSAICRRIEGKLAALPEGAGRGGRRDRMAEELGLSPEQQKQVQAIREAERAKNAPVMEELAGIREKIRSASEADTFDEAAVRKLAVSEANLMAELTVSRAHTRHDIDAVLTLEQRAQARKQAPPREPRRGPDCGPPPFEP